MALSPDNLGQPGLNVGAVAAHHCVAPRYVQRLFEGEGTTFSEYVRRYGMRPSDVRAGAPPKA